METTLHYQAPFSALIVDDNYALREAIARSLAREGGNVTTAPGGLEGLEAIRSHQFDVVITDVHMPRRGGIWLWEEALALQPDLRGKFVFMSSEPLPQPPSGAVFMIKPLSLATLQSEVRSIVRRSGRREGPCSPVRHGDRSYVVERPSVQVEGAVT
jgi:two-component system response regulator MprA